MDEEQEQIDLVLSQLASKAGGVKPLLASVFGFLHRRTDFYVEYDPVESPRATMGFPRGVSNKIVQDAFLQFPFKQYQDMQAQVQAQSTEAPPSATAGKAGGTSALVAAIPQLVAGSDKQVPLGNGGIGPNYYWTQTLQDATVYVDVAEGTRGKDVSCEIKAKTFLLTVGGVVLIDGEFEDPVRLDESMWTINISSSGTQPPQVVVTLDKTRKTWWKHAFVGHAEIDTSKVDSTQKIGEYDDATQASIRKIMFEQQQKRGKQDSA